MGRNAPILIYTVVKLPPPPPTDSKLQHYDYDIIMSSGGNRSPMLDLAQGVVAPRDGHSKCLAEGWDGWKFQNLLLQRSDAFGCMWQNEAY